MNRYFFECDLGCGIRLAKSLRLAQHAVDIEVGETNNAHHVREATEEDVAHVKAMGGFVPVLERSSDG